MVYIKIRIVCIKNGYHSISCPTSSVRILLSCQEVGSTLLPLNLGGLWCLLQGEKWWDFKGCIVRSDTASVLDPSSSWTRVLGTLSQHVRPTLKLPCWGEHTETHGGPRSSGCWSSHFLESPQPRCQTVSKTSSPSLRASIQ